MSATETTTTETTTETIYTFHPYDSQLPIDVPAGRRLVKCLYKGKKDKSGNLLPPAHPNEYITVPTSHLSEEVIVEQAKKLAPYVAAFLQSEEDKLIKEAHKKKSKGFGDSWFSLNMILASLDAAGQGSRLTKDMIENWFDSTLRDSLAIRFAEKLEFPEEPTDEQIGQLEGILAGYRAKFAGLAGGKTLYKEAEISMLEKALRSFRSLEGDEIVGDEIAVKLQNRLYSMRKALEEEQKSELIDLL